MYHFILKFACYVLGPYSYETLESIVLGSFPNCLLIGVSWLLLNYSFSRDLTEDLSGKVSCVYMSILLFSPFRIQFKDYLAVSKTSFPVLMRCTPALPKGHHCGT